MSLKWELAQNLTNRPIDLTFTDFTIPKIFSTSPGSDKLQLLMFLVMVHYQGIHNQLLFEKVDCYYSSKFIYVLYSLPAVPEYVPHILIGQNGNVAQLLMVIQSLFGLISLR